MSDIDYELFAIRYATREAPRSDHFIGGDPHDGPMPMDYFVWVGQGERSGLRDRYRLHCRGLGQAQAHLPALPVDALALLGVDADTVEDVVLTHLHYDHVGNFDRFPTARFHLQEAEMPTPPAATCAMRSLSHSFEVEDVVGMVRLNYDGAWPSIMAPRNWRPGIQLDAGGGHSAGLQFVRVNTRRGCVVLASDVTHFYENMDSYRPFTTALHIGDMMVGFDRLMARRRRDHIVPGHDPLVMRLYPAPSPDFRGSWCGSTWRRQALRRVAST